MNDEKEQIRRDFCKNHSARSDREQSRVIPSKLSKRELEDVYFVLFESNRELKRTVNSQQDQIKVLSTKVQRMTAKTSPPGKEPSCCAGSRAIIHEQRESLADLKRGNERLAERIRLLNMKLCSAKQFLSRNPLQILRCPRCSATCTSLKNMSMSALNTKRSDANLRTTSASCQYLDKDINSSRTPENDRSAREKGMRDEECNQNKCRTLMEEMKQKNDDLQEELSKNQLDYTDRITKLEEEVRASQTENLRVRSRCASLEDQLQQQTKDSEELLATLRRTEAQYEELNLQLCLEKRKVSELETRMKATEITNQVSKTIEEHLHIINARLEANKESRLAEIASLERIAPETDPPKIPIRRLSYTISSESKLINDKYGDDSIMSNNKLMDMIAGLQTQLDSLKAERNGHTTEDIDHLIENNSRIKSDKSIPKRLWNDVDWKALKNLSETNLNQQGTTEDIKIAADINIASTNNEKNDAYNRIEVSDSVSDSDAVTVRNDKHNWRESVKNVRNVNRLKKNDKNKSENNKDKLKDEKSGNMISNGKNSKDLVDDISTNSSVQVSSVEINKQDTTLKKNDDSADLIVKNPEKILKQSSLNRIIVPSDTPQNVNTDSKTSANVDKTKINNIVKKFRRKSSKDMAEQMNKTSNGINSNLISNGKHMETDRDNIHKEGIKYNDIKNGSVNKEQASINGIVNKNGVKNGTVGKTEMRSVQDEKEIASSGKKANDPDQQSTSQPHTYVIDKADGSRAASPDSTECEISSLTDLPSERDEKSIRDILSPGEQKTTTITETYTMVTTTDYGSLSEGELPVRGIVRSSSKELENLSACLPVPSTQNMEETLLAVNQELSRCKHLLSIQRPIEVTAPTSSDRLAS